MNDLLTDPSRMSTLISRLRTPLLVLGWVYSTGVGIAVVSLSWQEIEEHSFRQWLLSGNFAILFKSLVWPFLLPRDTTVCALLFAGIVTVGGLFYYFGRFAGSRVSLSAQVVAAFPVVMLIVVDIRAMIRGNAADTFTFYWFGIATVVVLALGWHVGRRRLQFSAPLPLRTQEYALIAVLLVGTLAAVIHNYYWQQRESPTTSISARCTRLQHGVAIQMPAITLAS